MGMWQRVWGLCLAHRDYLACPWVGHPPAMPGPWQPVTREAHKACSNITTSWDPSMIPSALHCV